jgi:hypothetical protein
MQWQLWSGPASVPISIKGLQALQVKKEFHLTGGTTVTPDLRVTGISSGHLIYDQLCLHHRLVIRTEKDEYIFTTNGVVYGDKTSLGNSHVTTYFVKNDVIEDAGCRPARLTFFDPLRMFLAPHFKEMEYDIAFQTWLQFGVPPQPQFSLFTFNWSMQAIARNHWGVWQVNQHSHSPREAVAQSIKLLERDTPPLDMAHYKSLKHEVTKFFQLHEELYCMLEDADKTCE